MSEQNRVLILYTGGTIGMKESSRGFQPEPGYLGAQLASLPQFHDATMPRFTTPPSRLGRRVRYDIVEYDPLLDSSNMGVEDWARIARDIERFYDDYDAFLVLHGTDTMAYTASALSFMLESLGKSVILTGSQIPLDQVRSDAIDNLLGALTIAGQYEIPEVCIYFNHKLLRGNRSQKWDALGFDAFYAGNLPPLAEVGVEVQVHWNRVRPMPQKPLQVHTAISRNVASLRIFPGITAELLRNFLQPPLEGLVLETYGTGNAPDRRADLLAVLREAHARGVIMLNCTQCRRGTVSTTYAAGAALAEVGVMGGVDMTPEAALTKLGYLLGKGLSQNEIVAQLQQDLRGELTEPHIRSRRGNKLFRVLSSALQRTLDTLSNEESALIAEAIQPALLCTAAANGDSKTLQHLLSQGADPNCTDYDGRSALHLAVTEKKIEVVNLLLTAGADPDLVDRWGKTPRMEASERGFVEITVLFSR